MSKQLPPGWATAQIGELFHTETGATPPKSDAQNYGTHIPLVKPPELRDGPVNSAEDGLSEAGASLARVLPPWSVLVSCIGNLGKTALNVVPVAFNQQINAILPNAELANPWFLLYQCQSARFRRALLGLSSATTIAIVNKSKFNSLELCVAPRPEQDRIVSKIDELFSRIDDGERALERVRRLVERYRQSVLKAAVTGELTREWREKNKDQLESGEALLARILTARREAWEKAELQKMKAKGITPANNNWKQKYEESPTPDTSNLPELPSGWVWTNLAQIKLFSLYGPRFSSEDYAESGCLVLRTSDINESGRVNVATAPKLKLSDEEFQKYRAEKGDLLITRTGSLGTLALFDDDVDAIPGAYLIQYRVPAPSVTRWYLFHFLKSPVGQRRLLTGGAGIGRPNLNAPTIEAIPIPLPPLEEQEAIVDRIERTLESVEKQLELLAMEAARSRALRQATLRTAFSGDLVAQDPADEPASALLERIAAARGTDTAAPKRGRKSPLSPDPSPARGEG